jgi:uncharacterized protein (TIGR00375 family)
MKFIADLHVHSGYSRATSRQMTPEGLFRWAQIKGISVVGTGDFTHPEWFAELRKKLEPAADGLYSLRDGFLSDVGPVPDACRSEVHFMLTAEIRSIYSRGGRTRKVHSLVFSPGFEEAAEINARLSAIGNLRSDGRPILGLDAAKLLQIVLDVSTDCVVVPAHAWTPHFSVFGAVSGFDSLEECYGDLAPYIFAIETGLSSDPPMNRKLSTLDNITLISNSDAHSPSKLGREANIFDTDISYQNMISALRTREGFMGTIEFFPEEGKYHYDGHRNCEISMHPEETLRHGCVCPVCGRRLTLGVMHRVEALADRKEPPSENFRSIIPLAEIIAETMQRGVNTKGVQNAYFKLVSALGNELEILLNTDPSDIERVGGDEVAMAVSRMRRGDIHIAPGYDGVYGKIMLTEAKANGKGRSKNRPVSKKGKRGAQKKLF